jgi:hypothetical protein
MRHERFSHVRVKVAATITLSANLHAKKGVSMSEKHGNDVNGQDDACNGSGLSRRTLLRGAAYTIPAVTVVALTAGTAEAASSGVKPTTTTTTPKGNNNNDLAFTGSGPAVTIAAAGAAAVAAGVAVQRAGKRAADPEV